MFSINQSKSNDFKTSILPQPVYSQTRSSVIIQRPEYCVVILSRDNTRLALTLAREMALAGLSDLHTYINVCGVKDVHRTVPSHCSVQQDSPFSPPSETTGDKNQHIIQYNRAALSSQRYF